MEPRLSGLLTKINQPEYTGQGHIIVITIHQQLGAPVSQWVKRWPTDLADRVRSPLGAKSSQP